MALRELTYLSWQMLLYGVLLVAVLFFMPEGVVPALRTAGPRYAGGGGRRDARGPGSHGALRRVAALTGVSFAVAAGT